MKYDGHGRQSRWIFPSKTSAGVADQSDYEQYGYDPNGNRTSLRKRDGSVLAFRYDALNRVELKQVPTSASGAPGYSVHYGYDNRGLQTHARFGSASGPGVTSAYDGFGRLASSTTSMDGVARTLSSTYDPAGNRTVLQGDSGYFARFDHDGLGRMAAFRGQAWIGYDPAGRRSSLGIGPGAPTSSTAYAYDGVGRLAGLTHDLAGTGSDQSLGFDYNAASQIVREVRSNDAYAWTGAVATNRPHSVNGQNQYTAAGAATFAYDANGNLTSTSSPDGTTHFVYDAENRLVSASGTKDATLAYDPLGRLWQASGPPGTPTTRFLYDGDRLVMEYDGSGNLLRSYVHGPGADEPLVWYEGTAGWAHRYLHADSRGSIAAIADINGSPVARNTYDEYGIPGANNQGRFQYTGQAWIPELGMYYYKARIYSPTLGRFLQTDPIGYADQVNMYAYLGNDPVNGRDPTGLAQVCAASTESRIRSCVGVDGNGDGNYKDNDLSSAQKSQISSAYRRAIVANRGRDLSGFGKPVSGTASAGDQAMTRVASQFVGAAYARSGGEAAQVWSGIKGIVANADKGIFGTGPAAQYNFYASKIEITGRRLSIWGGGTPYTSPSDLARLLFHEAGHPLAYLEGRNRTPADHQLIDRQARQLLKSHGLDGGGCVSLSYGLPFGGFHSC